MYIRFSLDEANVITADDLLPALVFLIVKTDIPNWYVCTLYWKKKTNNKKKNKNHILIY